MVKLYTNTFIRPASAFVHLHTTSMERVAEFLAEQYEGKVVTRTEDFCPDCCLGNYKQFVVIMPKSVSERKEFWMGEFEAKRLDPFAVLCNFVPKQIGGNMIASYAHFTRNLLNLSKPGQKCAEGRNCNPTCIFATASSPRRRTPRSPRSATLPSTCILAAWPSAPTSPWFWCEEQDPVQEDDTVHPHAFPRLSREGDVQEHAEIARKEAERQLLGLDFVAPVTAVIQPAYRGKKAMDFAPPDASLGPYPKVFVPPDKEPHKAVKSAAKPKPNSKLERLGESKYSHDIRCMFTKPVEETSNGSNPKGSNPKGSNPKGSNPKGSNAKGFKDPKKQGYKPPRWFSPRIPRRTRRRASANEWCLQTRTRSPMSNSKLTRSSEAARGRRSTPRRLLLRRRTPWWQ